MNESFLEKCHVFFSMNDEESFIGEIKFTPELGVEISIEAKLEANYYDVILCHSTFGNLYTLLNCNLKSEKSKNMQYYTSVFNAKYCVQNILFNKSEDLIFEEMEFEFSELNEWFDLPFCEVIENYDEKTIIIPHNSSGVKFKLSNNEEIHFNSDYQAVTNKSSYTIFQTSSISIVNHKKVQLYDLMETFKHFKLLLDVLFFRRVLINKITITRTDENDRKKRYNLLFAQPNFNSRYPTYNNIFFTSFKDIENNFEIILQKWFELKDKIAPVLDLLRLIFIKNGESLSNEFLNLAQALESFHRFCRVNNRKDNDYFDNFKKVVLENCPEEHKKVLSEILNYSNEPNLHTRLSELIDEFNGYDNFLNVINDKDSFIKLVKWNRNYYTHYDTKLKNKAFSGAPLRKLYDKLLLLLIGVLSKEIGFSDTVLDRQLHRLSRFYLRL